MFSHTGGDIGIGGIAANRAAQEGRIEFDNPLYGEWEPVTVQEGDHEYVSCLPFCIYLVYILGFFPCTCTHQYYPQSGAVNVYT